MTHRIHPPALRVARRPHAWYSPSPAAEIGRRDQDSDAPELLGRRGGVAVSVAAESAAVDPLEVLFASGGADLALSGDL